MEQSRLRQEFLGRVGKVMVDRVFGVDVRLIPSVFLIGDIIGIILAVIYWPTWIAVMLGYFAMAILAFGFGLAAYLVWKEDKEDSAGLVKLRNEQREDIRRFIHPILINLDWDLAHIDDDNWEGIRIELAFINLLVNEQAISRLSGNLSTEGYQRG